MRSHTRRPIDAGRFSREPLERRIPPVKRAWADPEVFAWNGKHYKLRYANLWPRPIQTPPPIWIPAGLAQAIYFWRPR
ncbi:MAG: LLM class flavin-dependent oxidoreductase [Gammaproteobacteria bacterium]|nr:LLM class flavin-dependent oxidoreductase [Gammaproteobacteria bacterium]